MTTIIKAPWTAEQVDTLNQFQRSPAIHPFTCPGHAGGGDRTLVATRSGWICPHCDYRQDWFHDFMVRWEAARDCLRLTPPRTRGEQDDDSAGDA